MMWSNFPFFFWRFLCLHAVDSCSWRALWFSGCLPVRPSVPSHSCKHDICRIHLWKFFIFVWTITSINRFGWSEVKSQGRCDLRSFPCLWRRYLGELFWCGTNVSPDPRMNQEGFSGQRLGSLWPCVNAILRNDKEFLQICHICQVGLKEKTDYIFVMKGQNDCGFSIKFSVITPEFTTITSH